MICDYILPKDIPAAIMGGVPAIVGLRHMPYRFTDAEAQEVIISRLKLGRLNDAIHMIHNGYHVYNPDTIIQVAQGGHTECIDFLLSYFNNPESLAEKAFVNLPHVKPDWIHLSDDLIQEAFQTRHSDTPYLMELAELVGVTRFIDVIGKKNICSSPVIAHWLMSAGLEYNYAEKLAIFTRACADGVLHVVDCFYHTAFSNSGWTAAANNDQPVVLERLDRLDRDNRKKHGRHFLLDLYYSTCRLWKFSSTKWIAKHLDPVPKLNKDKIWICVIAGRNNIREHCSKLLEFLEMYSPLDRTDFQHVFGIIFHNSACSYFNANSVMDYLKITYPTDFERYLNGFISNNNNLIIRLYERNAEIIKWCESQLSQILEICGNPSHIKRFKTAWNQGDFITANMLINTHPFILEYEVPSEDTLSTIISTLISDSFDGGCGETKQSVPYLNQRCHIQMLLEQ